jgi:integrase
MAIHKLTTKQVENSKPGLLGDGEGLWLKTRQRQRGVVRRFVFRYQLDFKYKEMPIGKFPDVTLDAARKKASGYRAALEDNRDPAVERREAKVARRAADRASRVAAAQDRYTFRVAAYEYADAIGGQKWKSAATLSAYRSHMKRLVFPVIGDMPLATIDTGLARRVLDPLSRSSLVVMHRVRGWCENAFAYGAAKMDLDRSNPFGWDRLKFVYPEKPSSEHYRAIDWRSIPELYARLVELGDDPAAMGCRLAILLALRPAEVRSLKFGMVNLANGTITLPLTKNGKPFTTFVTPPVATILERAAALRSGDYVFAGRDGRGPLAHRAMYTLCFGLTGGMSVHATSRACFSSWAYSTQPQIPDHIIEQALAHAVGNAVTRAYRRHGSGADLQRQLLVTWANYVTGVASNVLPFPATASAAAAG